MTNCSINRRNIQSITLYNHILEQASNIDLQLNNFQALIFGQCGISDISDKFNNLERRNQAKQLHVETLSILDVLEDSTHKNCVTTILKFRAIFIKEIKKSIRHKFLIPASICITSYKQKSVDTEENSDFLLEI